MEKEALHQVPFVRPPEMEQRREKNFREKDRNKRKHDAIAVMKRLVPGIKHNTSKKFAYMDAHYYLVFLEDQCRRRNLPTGENLIAAVLQDQGDEITTEDTTYIRQVEAQFLEYQAQHRESAEIRSSDVGPIRKTYVRRAKRAKHPAPTYTDIPEFTDPEVIPQIDLMSQTQMELLPMYPFYSMDLPGYPSELSPPPFCCSPPSSVYSPQVSEYSPQLSDYSPQPTEYSPQLSEYTILPSEYSPPPCELSPPSPPGDYCSPSPPSECSSSHSASSPPSLSPPPFSYYVPDILNFPQFPQKIEEFEQKHQTFDCNFY